jgi:hypothetical protein
MNFSPEAKTMAATSGRALDHIGFEVKGLEAFTKKLEAEGIQAETSRTVRVAALGIAIAFITVSRGAAVYRKWTEGFGQG